MMPSESNPDIINLTARVDMVKPDNIRIATMRCLEMAPAYFWKTPASVTGKHHPLWALGDGGLIRHTVGAVDMGINMGRYDVDVEPKIYTAIVPALILHDITKYGIKDIAETKESDPNMYWFNNHHVTAASFCRKIWQLMEWNTNETTYYQDEMRWIEICDMILGHVGRWGVKPTSKAGWIVHFADLAVSTRLPKECSING